MYAVSAVPIMCILLIDRAVYAPKVIIIYVYDTPFGRIFQTSSILLYKNVLPVRHFNTIQ